MSKRDHISLKTKLAAALLMLRDDETGELLIAHEHAKLLVAEQIISLFQADHYPIRKDDGGPDEPWNLTFRLIVAHRKKTAKIDIPQMAKSARLRSKEAHHAAVMAAKTGQIETLAAALAPLADPARARPKRKIANRPFPKGHRPMQSRNTLRRAET